MHVAVLVELRHRLYERSESFQSKSRFALVSAGGMLKSTLGKVLGNDPTLRRVGIEKPWQPRAVG
jgi:hypothetical protein